MALSWINGYNNIDYLNKMIRNVENTLSNDYNNLDNIPIIKIVSSTSEPQNIWELKEGMYLIDGIVYVDNNTSYEVSNLFVSMTARLENGKYVLSAFIPFFKGLYEYILKSNSTEYEEHQIVILATHEKMLTRYNETPYEPNGDYNPATKKYVDDKANEIITELDNMGVNKETTTSLKEENRIRDIKLQALLNETSDRNISISEDTHYFDMPLSIDEGLVRINEIVGDTLVNVCDQEESVAITKSYTVENENHIALQGEYDGSCRPVVYGNTLVNHNADWDDSLQTGVVTSASGIEDVQVEGIKGQEVSVVVEGNTVLNHALGKTSAVVSAIESENDGNYVDLTVANDMSSVVEIEGRTMVNICDQKDPIAITKSYTIENSGNHIALQGEYDGSCRPVIQGNTMVNLAPKYTINWTHDGTWQSLFLMGTQANATVKILQDLKPATTYTIIVNITKNTQSGYTLLNNYHEGTSVFLTHMHINPEDLGIKTFVATTRDSFDTLDPTTTVILRSQSSGIASGETVIEDIMIFEGDLTQTPELIPTEYVEGLKSSFEDEMIPTSITYLQGNGQIRDIYKSVATCNSFKPNTAYTYFIQNNGEEPAHLYINSNSMSVHQDLTINENNYIIGKCVTKEADLSTIWLSIRITQTKPQNLKVYLLEGDWTNNPPTYEEVTNHAGKYKVEYKVTGKNLFNIEGDVNQYYPNMYVVNNIANQVNGNTLTANLFSNGYHGKGQIIKVKPNTDYSISFNLSQNSGMVTIHTTTKVNYYIGHTSTGNHKFTFNTGNNNEICLAFVTEGNVQAPKAVFSNIQLEEGSTVTEYEPYKEYTKTFYLNSPLLEGDTIEDVNGVATHVKRYGKVVFDGNHGNLVLYGINDNAICFQYTNVTKFEEGNWVSHGLCINDRGFYSGNAMSVVLLQDDRHMFAIGFSGVYTYISIPKSKLTTADVNGFKQWLSENPTTVVYKLASPIYEPISTESILCDSYVNGHLDFDSAVPIEKVAFQRTPGLPIKYMNPITNYVIQFESDNIGKIRLNMAMDNTLIIDVVKGINKINVVTSQTPTLLYLYLNGIGFNASNIVVTEAIDADFDYFEGLKSSYEYEVTEDGKYKVDVKVEGGKNLVPPSEKWENGQLAAGGALWTGDGYSTISISTKDYIFVRGGFSYIFSYPSKYEVAYHMYNLDHSYISDSKWLTPDSRVFTPIEDCYIKITARIAGSISPSNQNYLTPTNPEDVGNAFKIQLEEGTVATSYEPYFESTKTIYLNSPLLEGDKIVTKNGKVYHYHKMGRVVLDGSNDEDWRLKASGTNRYMNVSAIADGKANRSPIKCDRFILKTDYNDSSIEGTFTSVGTPAELYIDKQVDTLSDFKQWLQANPTTVVYELASPYYELIDEYNNTILNIPKNVAHLTHTSTVPVNNTTFTNYIDELNVLEANTQYRVMFDCDKANIPFTITLGGTSQEVTSKKGTHSLLITTPSELVDKNLIIDGIGRCGIDNIRIFKGDVEYDYVKGLWSGYEERKLENLINDDMYTIYGGSSPSVEVNNDNEIKATSNSMCIMVFGRKLINIKPYRIYTVICDVQTTLDIAIGFGTIEKVIVSEGFIVFNDIDTNYNHIVCKLECKNDNVDKITIGEHIYVSDGEVLNIKNLLVLEGDWTDNPPTYEEVMANEGKYAVKVKLDTNATIFGKGGRL